MHLVGGGVDGAEDGDAGGGGGGGRRRRERILAQAQPLDRAGGPQLRQRTQRARERRHRRRGALQCVEELRARGARQPRRRRRRDADELDEGRRQRGLELERRGVGGGEKHFLDVRDDDGADGGLGAPRRERHAVGTRRLLRLRLDRRRGRRGGRVRCRGRSTLNRVEELQEWLVSADGVGAGDVNEHVKRLGVDGARRLGQQSALTDKELDDAERAPLLRRGAAALR